MLTRNIYFTLASEGNQSRPGIRPTTNKMQRFNTVVPWFKAGKMYFPNERQSGPEMVEMMEELSLASPSGFRSKKDDQIDNISMLGLMTVWPPSQEAVSSEKSDGLWEIDDNEQATEALESYIV